MGNFLNYKPVRSTISKFQRRPREVAEDGLREGSEDGRGEGVDDRYHALHRCATREGVFVEGDGWG